MRIPGGILNAQQCWTIADLADRYSTGCLQVTNRANLQIREVHSEIPPEVWNRLQELGIASRRVEVDPIRNIMASPTAGIDRQQLLDTRPLVKAWDDYLQTHPGQLLVMTAHKHNFFERVFSRSQTTAMAYETHIPLLILQDKK